MKTDHSSSDPYSVSREYSRKPQPYIREIHSIIVFPFSVSFPKKSLFFGFLD
jgi:hypothetical protein